MVQIFAGSGGGIDESRLFESSKPDFVAGRYYLSPGQYDPSFSTFIASSSNDLTLFFTPFAVQNEFTFDRMGISIQSAGTAAGVARIGLYNDDNGSPGTLAFDAGTVAIDATNGQEATINQTLSPGWYWFALTHNESAGVAVIRAIGPGVGNITGYSSGIETGTITDGWQSSSGSFDPTSALPASAPSITSVSSAPPMVWLRKT